MNDNNVVTLDEMGVTMHDATIVRKHTVRVNGEFAGDVYEHKSGMFTVPGMPHMLDKETAIAKIVGLGVERMLREWDMVEDASGQPYHLHILCKAITLKGVCPKCGKTRPFGA